MMTAANPRALLITRNLPPLVGGMERLVWHIADALRADYALHVIGPKGCRASLPEGVTASELPLKPFALFLGLALLRSIGYAIVKRPRLVFAGSGLTAPMAWFAAKLSQAKSVVYLHGLDIEARHWIYRRVWHPFIRRMDTVIANSQFTENNARKAGIDDRRIRVLNPGVDLPSFENRHSKRRLLRDRYQLASDTPLMLYVGRITARKGLAVFVREILPAIIQQQPEARLMIIGAEPKQALLRNAGQWASILASLTKFDMHDRIINLGELEPSDPRLTAAYFAADVLVFPVQERPGDNEGFGMVGVEAAAHGLPTVAFDAGGISDAVADGVSGRLVKAGDHQGFIKAVVDVLAKLNESSGIDHYQCRDFAIHFTWDSFQQRIGKLAALN